MEKELKNKLSKSRNWILLYVASLISNAGSAVSMIALPVLIYQTTGSTLQVGLTFTLFTLPGVLFGPFVGVVADRKNKKKIMLLADISRAVIVPLIPFTSLFPNRYSLFFLLFLYSCLNRLFNNSSMTMIPLIVEREKIQRAISLLASSEITARILGYMLSGTIVGTIGVKYCFILDGITYVLSAGCIVLLKYPQSHFTKLLMATIWESLKKGYNYSIGNHLIQAILCLFPVLYFCIGMQPFLLFSYVVDVLNFPKIYYSYLYISVGLGNLSSALLIAKYGKNIRPSVGMSWSYCLAGLCYIIISGVELFNLHILICFCIGILLTSGNIFWMSLFHSRIRQEFKGRVFSFLDPIFGLSSTMSFVFGTLIAEMIGPDKVFFLMGCIILVIVVGVMHILPIKKAFTTDCEIYISPFVKQD